MTPGLHLANPVSDEYGDQPDEAGCQACGQGDLLPFYEVSDIPVHSALQMPTKEAALDYPKGKLELVLCAACGFIQNHLFDAPIQEYSSRCDKTHGFSPTFNQLAKRLAADLFERYALAGRTVLEIGCGRGEFLELFADLGCGRLIGVDPASVPASISGTGQNRIEIIQGFYGPEQTTVSSCRALDCDLILCRNTLEHIGDVRAFIRFLRADIGDLGIPVVFELPSMDRILDEVAFWDVHHEHRSYFTRDSLTRLFEAAGFSVLRVDAVCDGQHLVIEAIPVESYTATMPLTEVELGHRKQQVERFGRCAEHARSGWRNRFEMWTANDETVVIWGANSKTVSFLTTLGLTDEVAGVVDINPSSQGTFLPGTGHRVLAPEEINALAPTQIIIMNGTYEDEIRSTTDALNLEPSFYCL